jgi:hypothetical protein
MPLKSHDAPELAVEATSNFHVLSEVIFPSRIFIVSPLRASNTKPSVPES